MAKLSVQKIQQLTSTTKSISFRGSTSCFTKQGLKDYLHNQRVNVTIGAPLKGGVDSEVYSAILNGQSVIIKHTEDRSESVYNPPFSEIDFYVPRENQNIDVIVLKKLSETPIRVPKVLHHFPDNLVTVMEDMRNDGYNLMLHSLIRNNLPIETASILGQRLGESILFSKGWKQFQCYKHLKNRFLKED